ncbi:uncharacterized protein CBL_06615 [Carabus blaptoides fortunei]
MKVIGENFVKLPIDESESKKNDIQEILNGNVPEETLKRCANQATSILTGIAELTDSLFLCSAVALRPSVLTALGVTCVVNAAAELPDTPLPNDSIVYFKVCILDRVQCDLLQHFDTVSDLIQEIRKSGGKTLVHCVAGVSRSASLCVAYLMKYQHMSLLQAYNYVKSKRPQIKPNNGFFRQLIEYEYRLFGENSVKMVYNDYVNAEIPEVYACDYQKMIWFQKTYNRNFGRH